MVFSQYKLYFFLSGLRLTIKLSSHFLEPKDAQEAGVEVNPKVFSPKIISESHKYYRKVGLSSIYRSQIVLFDTFFFSLSNSTTMKNGLKSHLPSGIGVDFDPEILLAI